MEIVKSNELLKYHRENGGISRYKKFEYFFKNIIKRKFNNNDIINLSKEYSKFIFEKLCECEIASGLDILRKKTSNKNWMIITGGDEKEVKKVFKVKKIDVFFNKHIYGSPLSKKTIFKKLISNKIIKFPAIYFGDSKYDYEVSNFTNIEFIFVSKWSELKNWKQFCLYNKIKSIKELNELNL